MGDSIEKRVDSSSALTTNPALGAVSVLLIVFGLQSLIEIVQADAHTTPPSSAYVSLPASRRGSSGYRDYTTVYGRNTQGGNVAVEEAQRRCFHRNLKIMAT
jgi:hypothetical protein